MSKVIDAIVLIAQIPFNILYRLFRPFRFFAIQCTLSSVVRRCDRVIETKISGKNELLEARLRSHQARIEIILSMMEQGLFDNMHDPIEIYMAVQENVSAIQNISKLIVSVPAEQL